MHAVSAYDLLKKNINGIIDEIWSALADYVKPPSMTAKKLQLQVVKSMLHNRKYIWYNGRTMENLSKTH